MDVTERGADPDEGQEADDALAASAAGRQDGVGEPPVGRRPAAANGSVGSEPPSPTAAASQGEDGSEAGSPKLQPSDSKQSTLAPASSVGSDAGSGSGSSEPETTHYDSSKDVVLRMEFLSTPEVKALFRSVRVSVLVGLGMLAVAIYLKVDKPNNYYLSDETVPIVNICFAAVLLPALLAAWGFFFWRVYRSNLSGKRWSHRRKRAVTLAGVEVSIQLTNCIFYLVPNVYVYTHDCAWFHPVVIWSGFIRWSCWNSLFLLYWVHASSVNPIRTERWRKRVARPDAAVMDAPLWCHYRKLALWVVLEGILIALSIVARSDHGEFDWDPNITDCRQQGWTCQFSSAAITLLSLNVACLVAYFLMWLWNIARSFNNLKYLPYGSMRMANLVTRMQVRLRGLAITFFILCVVVYTFVKLSTCSSYIISWLGYLPMQIVSSVTACASAYMWMPKRPHEMGILQAWLAEFAWTESDIPRKRAERASSLPPESFEHFCIDCEPLFCFETAVKMLYWSFLVYDHEEHQKSPFNPTTALSLYDLECFEVFWEKQLDTKCCVGWNEDTVVISFRGTSSLKNVQADLQVWRSRFPTGVGSLLLGTAPLVHSGFLAAYTANGFNERLLARLQSILFRCTSERAEAGNERPVNVYVTGHSLGGALASLCAFDIKKRCPCAEYLVNVRCLTFGAPRVGNRAWARLYNQAVPDTWHLINSDDVVTSAGKFFFLYTRTGHRVLVNKLGDIIVRPTYLESQIRQVVGGGSVKDHLLTQYQKAISAVVAAQFGRKQSKHGKDGVLSLARSKGTRDVLEMAGLAGRKLEVLQSQGWDAYQKLLRQEARAKSRQRSRRRRTGSRDSQDLEAVVVAAAASEEEVEGREEGAAAAAAAAAAGAAAGAAAAEPAGPAGAAGAAAGTAPAAAAGESGDIEAGTMVQECAEESGGVLHTQAKLRQRSGCACRTICRLMPKSAASEPVALSEPLPGGPAAEAAAAEREGAPAPLTPRQGQLEVIAEEGVAQHARQGPLAQQAQQALHQLELHEEQSLSPQDSPRARQRQPGGVWRQLASMLGWEQGRALAHTLSGISLASSASGGSSPTSSGRGSTGVRGSMRDTGSAFPLVLDWTSSGDAEALAGASSGGLGASSSGRRELPEAASGRAIAEYGAARRGTTGQAAA